MALRRRSPRRRTSLAARNTRLTPYMAKRFTPERAAESHIAGLEGEPALSVLSSRNSYALSIVPRTRMKGLAISLCSRRLGPPRRMGHQFMHAAKIGRLQTIESNRGREEYDSTRYESHSRNDGRRESTIGR